MYFSRTQFWSVVAVIVLFLALLPIYLRYQTSPFYVTKSSSATVLTIPTPPTKASLPTVVQTLSKDVQAGIETVIPDATASSIEPSMPTQTRSVWVVQLASYAELERAQALVRTLQEAGYASYVHPVSSPHATYYRVLVGPVLLEKNALDIKDSLAHRFHQTGLVVKTFDPLHD